MRRSIPSLLFLATCFVAGLALAACGGDTDETPETVEPARVPGVVYDDHGEPEGLHRYRRWSEKVGQGAQPTGEVAFRNLAALGYKTILSVDGANTEVELAARHGLTYVHVPIGYDAVPREAALQIVKATLTSDGPIYVHCHHGRHRGPAAAMLCRVAADGISSEEAVKGLEESGTSVNYKGLWRDVRTFEMPSEEALAMVPSDLPSRVKAEGLRASMVKVSHGWERLKLCKEAGWQVPTGHPDVDPPHEARMLWEVFRELARTDAESKAQGEIFIEYLKSSEKETIALEEAIRKGEAEAADGLYGAVKQLCVDCHTNYRD